MNSTLNFGCLPEVDVCKELYTDVDLSAATSWSGKGPRTCFGKSIALRDLKLRVTVIEKRLFVSLRSETTKKSMETKDHLVLTATRSSQTSKV